MAVWHPSTKMIAFPVIFLLCNWITLCFEARRLYKAAAGELRATRTPITQARAHNTDIKLPAAAA